MRMTPDGATPLPRSVIWDPKRNRYRVRLYLDGRTIWLSYCRDLETAIMDLERAEEHRMELRRGPSLIQSAAGFVAAIKGNHI